MSKKIHTIWAHVSKMGHLHRQPLMALACGSGDVVMSGGDRVVVPVMEEV